MISSSVSLLDTLTKMETFHILASPPNVTTVLLGTSNGLESLSTQSNVNIYGHMIWMPFKMR